MARTAAAWVLSVQLAAPGGAEVEVAQPVAVRARTAAAAVVDSVTWGVSVYSTTLRPKRAWNVSAANHQRQASPVGCTTTRRSGQRAAARRPGDEEEPREGEHGEHVVAFTPPISRITSPERAARAARGAGAAAGDERLEHPGQEGGREHPADVNPIRP